MKKKFLIPIILSCIVVILILGLGIYLLINRAYSIITLEINPSIEIRLDKNNKVKKVVALNKDAKEISKEINTKDLDKTIIKLYEIIKKKYYDGIGVDMLFHSEGNLSTDELQEHLIDNLKDNNINLIKIEKVTTEDKKLARKYNISGTKAAYLNEISKKYENIPIDQLVNSSIKELTNTLNDGYYCKDSDRFLDGEFCLKELKRIPVSEGKICPDGYNEYNGVCYKWSPYLEKDNKVCPMYFEELNDKECILKEYGYPEGECESGENNRFDSESGKCEEWTPYADMVEICRITRETDLLMDHKCYGPKPTINGGCLGSDVIINGGCVDLGIYYEADWECPDGVLYDQEKAARDNYKCLKKEIVEPKRIYCQQKDQKLIDGKCYREEIKLKQKERYCEDNATLIDQDRCLIMSDTTDFIDGYVCDEPNSRVVNNECIIYDIVNAERGE